MYYISTKSPRSNERDEWEYYVAVASTKETDEYEEFVVPPSTWAVFYEEGPVIKMQELDQYLTPKGSKRTMKAAKSGFVTSYTSPVTGKALLNYVFRKTGVKMRMMQFKLKTVLYRKLPSDFGIRARKMR